MVASPQNPSESALLAAYQVTAECLKNEGQLIWLKTGVFVALNALVATALQFIVELPAPVRFVLALLGCLYAVGWHFSMTRAWNYHSYYVRLMREQEEALRLMRFGPFSRGRAIAEGTPDTVGGERTTLGPIVPVFRAKALAHSITWLFFLVYLMFVIRGIFYVAK